MYIFLKEKLDNETNKKFSHLKGGEVILIEKYKIF